MKEENIFYIRTMTREGYAYEPIEFIIGQGKRPYNCECYGYRTHDDVMHLIQCDHCGRA